MTGEELHDAFGDIMSKYGLIQPYGWQGTPPIERAMWIDFADHVMTHLLPQVQATQAPVFRPYAVELKKFGRHLPTCPTSPPCTCGFAEVEKELYSDASGVQQAP